MTQVERVDFINIATRDAERAQAWYQRRSRPASGRAQPGRADGRSGDAHVLGAREGKGSSSRRASAGSPSGFPTWRPRRKDSEAKGVEFVGSGDTGVCRMAVCLDPDGNALILHRRYKPYE